MKPRLPQSMVLLENEYQPLDREKLAVYDEAMLKYYENRPVTPPFTEKKSKDGVTISKNISREVRSLK